MSECKGMKEKPGMTPEFLTHSSRINYGNTNVIKRVEEAVEKGVGMPTGVKNGDVQESVEFNGKEAMGLNVITPGEEV